MLTGLGFKQSDWTKLCSEFSGGWQVTQDPLMHLSNLTAPVSAILRR